MLNKIIELNHAIMNSLRVMSAYKGTKVYGGTSAHTGLNLKALSIREDGTTFSTLTINNSTGKVITFGEIYLGTSVTIKGDLIVVPEDYRIVAMTMTSGSVIGTSV